MYNMHSFFFFTFFLKCLVKANKKLASWAKIKKAKIAKKNFFETENEKLINFRTIKINKMKIFFFYLLILK